MNIYNTLSRTKEELTIPADGLKIYACGPTVYNFIHIGNARPLCVFDVLRRYLEWRGVKVTFVQNFTDIDDKLINKANEEGRTVPEIAEQYIREFWVDAKGLNIRPADVHPRATENIDEIIRMIRTLCDQGYAYAAQGDVYFRAARFDEYGKLSRLPLDDLRSGARVDVSNQKEDPADFALWKAAKPGEPSWDSPWGPGRPGWHIECSAMARRYLGNTIDIHCGGQDLIFPHHENEIAQSECANGSPFARYWMHNGYINVDNRKMSKSLGNFFTLREVAAKYGYEPIRMLMISAHYRTPINYSTDILEPNIQALERLYNCRSNLQFVMNTASQDIKPGEETTLEIMANRRERFIAAMDDDLNTADALAALFDLTRDINSATAASPSRQLCKHALELFDNLCGVLGLLYEKKEPDRLDKEIEQMIEARTMARKNRDFQESDRLRDELKSHGIVLEDTPQGVKWHRES